MTIYKIKMLKSKHGADIGDVIPVHPEEGFVIGKLKFKPYIAKSWIENGSAKLEEKKRVKVNDGKV